MFSQIIFSDDSFSEEIENSMIEERTYDDIIIETYFLVGLISKFTTIQFSIEETEKSDLKIPRIEYIQYSNDLISFNELKGKDQDELIFTHNYLLDLLILFNYKFELESFDCFEMIYVLEDDKCQLTYFDQISNIGYSIYNLLYKINHILVINNQCEIIQNLFWFNI